MERFDILIIGSGPAGYEIAAELAAKGQNVALVERDRTGGTCLNRGCIPTKCLCATAQSVIAARNAAVFGVATGSVSVDYSKAFMRMRDVVGELRSGVEQMLAKVNVVRGCASITPDGSIDVAGKLYSAEKVLIATGSAPSRLSIPGAELALTSDDILEGNMTLPERLVIIGGGVIGIEFASIYNALGCDVTVIEYCKEILPQFDSDIAKRLRIALQARGINFATGAAVRSISPDMEVLYTNRRGDDYVKADMVLMATGRRPVLPTGCIEAGIEVDDRGFISVDERMRTTRDGFYAAGDVTGICMLAHAATAQARIALTDADVDLDIIPSAVFSAPEVAMAGLTAADCERYGVQCRTARCNYASNGKAQAMGATSGCVKLVYNPETRLILGAHVLGEHASDLVAEVAALMYGMTTIDELAEGLVHSHPTLSELLQTAAKNAE